MTAPHDVLRYWLSIIRREEALTSAIRAAPPVRREPSVDLRNPGRGQTYFKLGLLSDPDVPALCLREQSTLDISLQGDRMLFFEHWLRRRYISRRSDDDGPQVMLGFPVIYQPRRGELSTLLRFPMESIIWKDATQQQWTAPLPRDLRSSVALVPPMSLTLRTDGRPEGLPKFSVDELAATRLLGISEEQIPWLQVSTEDTLARMCALLTAAPDTPTEEISPEQTTDESDADATMRVLLQKISSRLDSSLG
ncbi:MAG: hypothetical protein VX223_03700, partial [Myxococcota bacterium]|nr:hypothetical protein [Myxococcota bacterium]